MTKPPASTLDFVLDSDTSELAWNYKPEAEITAEQAMVIAHTRGLAKIASAIESLALAVDALAEKLPHPDDA